jgi:hypothetical protein
LRLWGVTASDRQRFARYIIGRTAKGEHDIFGGDGQAKGLANGEHMRLLLGGNTSDLLPPHDGAGVLAEGASRRTDTAEQCENRDGLIHDHACAKKAYSKKAIICADGVQNFCMAESVTVSINTRLKELRKSAVPALSIRAMADALEIGHSRYAYFEDPKRFKKHALPLDLTRQIASVLSQRGVDAAEVMKLAGLTEDESEPEARAVEAARPAVQFFTVQAVMPSEAALAAMFETLLALIPADATRAEAARILAQQLPTGFGAIGPGVIEEDPVATHFRGAPPPTGARGDREPLPPLRS